MTRKVSTTDSDSGLFIKGEHERCFAYSAQTACDKHGFVLAFEVVAGNSTRRADVSRALQENGLKPDADSGNPQCLTLAPRPRTAFSENVNMFTMNISPVIFVRRIKY